MPRIKYYYPYSYRKRRLAAKILDKKSDLIPIIICKKRKLIDENEFFAANYFLSLYRLRYGYLFVRAESYIPRDKQYRGFKSENDYLLSTAIYHNIIREL